MHRKKICVLMTTYNPPEYFKEQVKSILEQKDVDVELYVRDDASTHTENLKILDGLRNVHLIRAKENTGTSDNIKALLNYAKLNLPEYKYYAYSDQDDVCKLNKYFVASEEIDKLDDYKPALYCGNLLVCDKNLNPSHELFPRNVVNLSVGQSLAQVFCFACTTMFNKKMLDTICNYDFKRIGFDSLLYYIGIVNRNIFYDDETYIYYRQHGDNVSGIKRKGLQYFAYNSLKVLGRKKENEQAMKFNATYLLNYFSDKLTKEEISLCKTVSQYNTFFSRLHIIHDQRIKAGYMPKDFYNFVRIILNKY